MWNEMGFIDQNVVKMGFIDQNVVKMGLADPVMRCILVDSLKLYLILAVF